MRPIYLDYNATTPIDSEVAAAMLPYMREHFGNPSSSHWYGLEARKGVEKARGQVAALLNCSPPEIIFTSGGTESNNHAIKGAARAPGRKGNHIVTSAFEHPAVTKVCEYLAAGGCEITYVPVDTRGIVNLEALKKAITERTILISVMHANNEAGTIQPIGEIARIARDRGILCHTDAAQSVGKIPVDVAALGVDLLSVAGHKLYAPKGIGALFIRDGIELEKFMHGAGHEQGRRAGTENVIEIAGLGMACEIAKRDLAANVDRMKRSRDRLEEGLLRAVEDARVNGHPEKRLPNTLSVSFRGIDAGALLQAMEGLAASAGAACHGNSVELSPTLCAMAVPAEWARGTIRLSTGKCTTQGEIDRALEIIATAVKRLRSGVME
ncbi:MAG TPA: cysteine desulfurase family protein [Syntrophales bacterium]|nr:cysteine desulfurase family protein [Syntrophales bacterium]